jgi:predicted CxxxxCH...CXXCH cytochrome family protein
MAGSGSGHTDSGDNIFSFRHNTFAVPCIVCHVSHGTTAAMGTYSGTAAWPNGGTAPSGDARSSLLRGNNRAICVTCHVDANGRVGGGGCNSCHDAPPATGAHLAHSNASVVGYGMVGSYGNAADYAFGCGECHPTDSTLHQNGTVDVVLDPAGAPSGSLKEKNAPGAAFSGGTCSNVYCHSGEQVSSGAVGNPLRAGGTYILDSHGNFTYDPYTVTISRSYATTPAWSGGSVSGNCIDCHEFPLTTSFPSVQAGVGDSHQWIDDYGYGNLHAYNMSFNPLACSTCHYGEITAVNTWSRVGDVTTYNPVPLADRAAHVNGQADVTFNTVDSVMYGTTALNLTGATYNSVERSCANVACHINQNYVVWGSPYRWQTECDLCHRYGLPPVPLLGVNIPSESAPLGGQNNTHSPAIPAGSACTDCHTKPHGK